MPLCMIRNMLNLFSKTRKIKVPHQCGTLISSFFESNPVQEKGKRNTPNINKGARSDPERPEIMLRHATKSTRSDPQGSRFRTRYSSQEAFFENMQVWVF